MSAIVSPANKLHEISALYKGIFPLVEKRAIENLAEKERFLMTWDEWIFSALDLKFPNWSKGLKHGDSIPQQYFEYLPSSVGILQSAGLWRYTKSIYQFDETIGKMLIASEFNGKIPSSVLENIPEWVVYIDTSNLALELENTAVSGIYFNVTETVGNLVLVQTVLLSNNVTKTSLMMLSDKSIEENIADFVDKYHNKEKELDMVLIEPFVQFLKQTIHLLLFVLQPEPDIYPIEPLASTSSYEPFKKTKKGIRLFEAQKTRTFKVGTDTKKSLDDSVAKFKAANAGGTVIPHIRRGHWHGYWSGSKDSKKFSYKWVLPIIVNGN